MAVIRKKVIRDAITELEEVHRTSTMENANFTDSLKGKVKLWLWSWIEAPVKRVIDNLKAELERGDK